MPKRKATSSSTRAYKRRRTFKRRYKRRYCPSSFNKAPMPNKFATKMRYQETAQINPALGIPGLQVVTANGLYDPNITLVGHQPRGFDQLMTMYDHYTVIGAKITCTFCMREGLAYDNLIVGIALRDTSTTAQINDYLESRTVTSRTLRGSDGAATVSGLATLSLNSSTGKFLGRSKVMSDSELKGNASANPAEQLYFHLFAQSVQSGDAAPLDVNYRIDYLVVFTEPKQPTQS